MAEIVKIEGLKKSFGEIKAVDGISFSVKEGSFFAFLGINGAGKSTTINILCSILKKDEGHVVVDGHDIDFERDQIKRELGVVFQGSILDASLSVKDNLEVRASFYGIYGKEWKKRLDEISELLEMRDLLDRPYGKLSGGQRRRADVARGLIHKPKLLILDEPTTGLDPQNRKKVWEVIDRLRKNTNMTVFLTTHYMEEANEADDVVILDAGKIAAQGNPVSLKKRYSSDYVKLYLPRSQRTDKMLENYDFEYTNCYVVKMKGSGEAKLFVKNNFDLIDDFEIVKGDMDDVFLKVTGKTLSGGAL